MKKPGMIFFSGLFLVLLCWGFSHSAENLNAYSIWPENWARPMFEEFEKATGVHVNFIRFSSGEALARIIAEKNNPRVDVLFGGPVETHIAGIKEGVFEPYKPAAFGALLPRFKDPEGYWVGIADDPLVFMSNNKFLKEKNLTPPSSWTDLLDPAYKGMLQMADARTSGTAVTRIFSIIEVFNRDENKAFDYMKKLRKNVQVYTKSGGGGTIPVGLGQAGAGIFSILGVVAQAAGNGMWISFLVGGVVALLCTYSYAKLGVRFPSAGGAVEFLVEGFGDGVLSGGLNLYMWIGYVIALALYAQGFVGYALTFLPSQPPAWVPKGIGVGIVLLFTGVNFIGARTVGRAETFIVVVKLAILALFAGAGGGGGGLWGKR